MPPKRITKISKKTEEIMKTEAYKKQAARIATARKAKGMPDLTQGLLGRLRRSKAGKVIRTTFTPQTEEAKRQIRRKPR